MTDKMPEVGDVIINEDSSVSKIVKKTKNAIFTDIDKKPNLINRIKCYLRKNKCANRQ